MIGNRIATALDLFARFTDGPEDAEPVACRFAQALSEAGGEAALEIGVRAGGMSAIFCYLAARLRPPPFMVFSIDPWGCAPYAERGEDVSSILAYGERFYAEARALLARFPNSVLYRLDADLFLDGVLPHLRWWFEHTAFPTSPRFLSFAYLDGRHDAASVVSETMRVLPHVAPRGCVLIDNVDKCPEAAAFLRAAFPRLRIEDLGDRRLGISPRV